jgi:hypothetical protein
MVEGTWFLIQGIGGVEGLGSANSRIWLIRPTISRGSDSAPAATRALSNTWRGEGVEGFQIKSFDFGIRYYDEEFRA